MERALPGLAALICLAAAVMWGRATVGRKQVVDRLSEDGANHDLVRLAVNDYRRDMSNSVFAILSFIALTHITFIGVGFWTAIVISALAVPCAVGLANRQWMADVARIAADRTEVERKASEVLNQDQLAPYQWAARLAPADLPNLPGFEIGQAYHPGSGAMAGDFYDIFDVDVHRVAAVIGDVTGHGIEPSITALQAKYLLRVLLQQFRDPGQALEQLNAQMSVLGRGEEFISLCVMVFDKEAESLRFASAGHPAAFVWDGREVRPLGATGPLLMLDPKAPYHSREMRWLNDNVAVLYTDGLAEARSGEVLFGEDGIASLVRRDPTASPDVLTKTMVDAARDFAGGPIADDVAVLVIRKI